MTSRVDALTMKVASLAFLLAVATVAGCNGPTIHEVDGGTAGASGAAGRGGTAGASGTAGRGAAGASGTAGRGGAAGGTGGAGCAAQMTTLAPVFYRGELPPAWTEGTSHRFYWAEKGSDVTVHYAQGDQPVEVTHPLKIAGAMASNHLDLAASDSFVAGNWDTDGKLAVWGPDATPTTPMGMMTLSRSGAVTIAGATAYYSHDPTSGTPTPGVYQWPLPSAASLFASFTSLGGGATLGLLLRATSDKLLFSDGHKVYVVDLAGGSPQLLFMSTSNAVTNIRPARPHSLDAGVIIVVDDLRFVGGADHYVDLTRPGIAPTDLSTATTSLAVSTACGYDAQYVGSGVLFNHRYIYQGQFGLFAVDVAANGELSNLVRLADAPYSYLEVTGDGDLFGSWPDVNNVGKWEFSRIGRL